MTTKYRYGAFVWRELLSRDPAKAARFYGELFGWKTESMAMPDGQTYTVLKTGDKSVGGIFKMSDAMKGVPSHWIPYVSVEDVDAASKRATDRGGKVVIGPMDIPNVGRMAAVMDPMNGSFYLFKSAMGDPEQAMPKPGEFCWEDLSSTDLAKSKDFYSNVVGWKITSFMGMDTFGIGEGMQNQVASLQQAPPGVPQSWLCHVVVDGLGAARDRAKRLGATVMMEEVKVPTVGSFAVIQDPDGAVISLFEGEKK